MSTQANLNNSEYPLQMNPQEVGQNSKEKQTQFDAAIQKFNRVNYGLFVILLAIIVSRSVAAGKGDLSTVSIVLYAISYGLWWICVIVGIISAKYMKESLLKIYQLGLGIVLVLEIIGDIYAFRNHTSSFPLPVIIILMVVQIIMMSYNILRARNLRILMIALLAQKPKSNIEMTVK